MKYESFWAACFKSYKHLETAYFDIINFSIEPFRKKYEEYRKRMPHEQAFRQAFLEHAEKELARQSEEGKR